MKETKEHIKMNGDMSKPYQEKLKKMELIKNYFQDAWSEICKRNTLNFEEVSKEHFRKLIALIQKRQLVEDETMREIEDGVPIGQESLPSINMRQNGEKSIMQIVNGGTVRIRL
jgi:hypothetical protein